MQKLNIILDPGHGGIDPQTGLYVTSGKRSRHEVDGSYFYEGHEMRKYVKEWRKLFINAGYSVSVTVDPDDHRDVSLKQRVIEANTLHGSIPSVLISIHSNADSDSSPRKGQARGKEVFTSPGLTPSDHLAKFYVEEFEGGSFKHVKFRKDMSDGFPDKEAAFYMLTQTKCPAILIELGFHTNDEDVRLMRQWDYRLKTGLAAVRAVQRFEKWNQ